MKTRLLVVAMMILVLGLFKAHAQTWTKGVTLNEADINNTPDAKVFLYNPTTDYYVGGSGMWGTQAFLFHIGKLFQLINESSGNTTVYSLRFNQGGDGVSDDYRYIGWGNNSTDNNILFINARKDLRSKLTFTPVTVAGKENVYNVSLTTNDGKNTTVYLMANAKETEGRNKAVAWTATKPDASDERAHWMLIRNKQFLDKLNEVMDPSITGTKSADATNLLRNPRISAYNSGAASWKVASTVNNGTTNGYVRLRNYTSGTDTVANLKHAGSINSGSTLICKPTGLSDNVNYVYGGVGYGSATFITTNEETGDNFKVTNDINDGKNNKIGTINNASEADLITYDDYTGYNGDKHAETYLAKYWTANIHRKAIVYQEISTETTTTDEEGNTVTEPLPEGWYNISCKGFTTGEAKLYAKAGTARAEEPFIKLNDDEVPATYALGGKLLMEGDYTRGLRIHVPAGTTTLTIGIEGISGWTSFNNFQITYMGPAEKPFLFFDEEEQELDYFGEQENNIKYGLYLHRTLLDNKWNSLILPIDLDNNQVKDVFGQTTKLAKLEGINEDAPYTIRYTLVDLTVSSSSALEAGQHYIIKPSNSDHVTIENWKTERLDKNETSGYATLDLSGKDDTYKANIYLIKNVTFEKIPENNITDESSAFYGCTTPQDFEVINNPQFTGLRHYGTYVWKKEPVIEPGAFLLSNGEWYHTQNKSYSVKGFRTWIDTQKVPAGTQITFSISGIKDNDDVVTGIGSMEMTNQASCNSQCIYDLNGRLVRTNGSGEGLAKGIYIKNGKKIVIK